MIRLVVEPSRVVVDGGVLAQRLVVREGHVRAAVEVREQLVESIAVVSNVLRPLVIGAIGASVVHHEVQCTGTAQSLAASVVNASVSEAGLWCCLEAPVDQRQGSVDVDTNALLTAEAGDGTIKSLVH